MQPSEAYCTGCGKPRSILYRSVEAAHPIVGCGRVKRPGTFNKAEAKAIIKARRARLKARRAARAAQVQEVMA